MEELQVYLDNYTCEEIENPCINIITEGKELVDIKNVVPMQIPNKEVLLKIVNTSDPTSPIKDKAGKGLYAFNELLKTDSKFADVCKAPYFPLYVAFINQDIDKDDRKSVKFYGLAGFSCNYFIKKNKEVIKDIDPKYLKDVSKYLHIILWQTDPKYTGNDLAEKYLDILKNAAKETKAPAITIKKSDDKTVEAYKKLGFEESDILKDYLILPLKPKALKFV